MYEFTLIYGETKDYYGPKKMGGSTKTLSTSGRGEKWEDSWG